MCGIVGIVSRPSSRPTPTGTELLGGLDAALAARGDVLAVAAAAGAVDAALRGVPGVLALVEHHELVAAITARLDQLDAYAAEVDAELGRSVARRRRAGAGQRRLDRPARRAVGDPPRPLAHGARGRRPRRPRRRSGRPRRLPGDPAGVLDDRPHGGPRPRLRRHPRLRVGPRPRRRRSGARRHRSPSGDATRCSRAARPASPGGRCRSCTRRRPRSVSSATTPA